MAVISKCATLLAGLFLLANGVIATAQTRAGQTAAPAGQWDQNSGGVTSACAPATLGSPYIPVDSWVYPAVLRLYSLGYVDNVYLGMRPWTRASVGHMLEESGARIVEASAGPTTSEAQGIYNALMRELRYDVQGPCLAHHSSGRVESVYTVGRGISGTPLRDSFHLGSTIINDYGRPYENGFNNYTGASAYAVAGRFSFYVRGEFEGAPSASGYSPALANALRTVDNTNFLNASTGLPYSQTTIPMGPISTFTDARFIEAYASFHVRSHEISFGKQDDWLGPGLGSGMAYSNNAENIYSFRINRVEPLRIPLLSRLAGPFRYEFLVGSLRGHRYIPNPSYINPILTPNQPNVINPGDPWVHVEKISMRPTENFELGFERTVIWGGQGHGPITVESFLRSFFSTTAGGSKKYGRDDPGARFGAFDFSYRLPYARNWLTLYTDAEVHDDVSPIDAPRRASWRPGLYLSHVPGIPKLDVRAEAVYTDPPVSTSNGGHFMYWEGIQKQGYTNQGQLFGDWVGREGKGGQAWITYHLSGNEWIQVSMRNQKTAKDFIPGSSTPITRAYPGGTTLNDINFQAVKRIGKDFEINGNFTYERWKAPIYLSGEQTVTSTTIQLTWYPDRKVSF